MPNFWVQCRDIYSLPLIFYCISSIEWSNHVGFLLLGSSFSSYSKNRISASWLKILAQFTCRLGLSGFRLSVFLNSPECHVLNGEKQEICNNLQTFSSWEIHPPFLKGVFLRYHLAQNHFHTSFPALPSSNVSLRPLPSMKGTIYFIYSNTFTLCMGDWLKEGGEKMKGIGNIL